MVIVDDNLLESIWLSDDREQRKRRTLIHEAGHAATSWLISGIQNAPPFEYIEIQTFELATQGIVPGYVPCDPRWFASRSPVERAEIYLGGIYCQNRGIGLTNAEWVDMLDNLEGGDELVSTSPL